MTTATLTPPKSRKSSTPKGRFDPSRYAVDFREVRGQIEALAGHYERLQQEYHAIVEALRRMEAAHSDDRRRRETLERRLREVHEELTALRARVEELERRLPG